MDRYIYVIIVVVVVTCLFANSSNKMKNIIYIDIFVFFFASHSAFMYTVKAVVCLQFWYRIENFANATDFLL